MTDLTAQQLQMKTSRHLDLTSAQGQARIRARYRTETRFKAYGIAALTVTTVFLLTLISNILIEGIPAFWQHHLVLDVPLNAEKIDPKGTREIADIRAGDYDSLARDALRTAVPGIEGRAAKKQLNELLSSGAVNELREKTVADPSTIGTTVKANLLLSDTADLFLKGKGGTKISSTSDTRGSATPSAIAGDIKIQSSTNDFERILSAIKADVKQRASAMTAEADRLEKLGADAATVADMRKERDDLKARYEAAEASEGLDDKMPSQLVAINGGLIKILSVTPSEATGTVLIPLASADAAKPGSWQITTYETPEQNRNINDQSIAYLKKLEQDGKVERAFNWLFFTSGDSREPELAGILGSLIGSAFLLLVTLALCLPIGVMAAIYLEEFAPKNWLTDIIEININNLAAVPSIVFGLLGLAVFLNFFGLPRSAPLVGGLVMALLVMPTIIIAARAALKAVPPSIKEAALGVGASKQQAIFHHVLPLAMPGIMTGTIIGMAHALGETAPLLMIGMIAFIVDVPESFTDAATALPVQIYLWSDLPEPAFQAKTAAAIVVLLVFLFVMNGAAIWLRKKFERRW